MFVRKYTDIVKGLLKFIYLGDSSMLDSCKPEWEVYGATHKFELDTLQERAERKAAQSVSLENLRDSIVILDTFPGKGILLNACAKFIKHNSLLILQSPVMEDEGPGCSILEVAETHSKLWRRVIRIAMGEIDPDLPSRRRRRSVADIDNKEEVGSLNEQVGGTNPSDVRDELIAASTKNGNLRKDEGEDDSKDQGMRHASETKQEQCDDEPGAKRSRVESPTTIGQP